MTDSTSRLTAYKVGVLVTLAGMFAYFNAYRGAWVFDDIGNITADPNIGRPLGGVMAPRPVVSLSFTANYLLDGLNTRGYHLGNLLVHAAAALALFGLTRRTLLLPKFGGKFDASAPVVAAVLALLWFLHPIQTQSVTYIVQRCESLMGLFFLLAMYCFVRGATENCRWWHAGAVASCALSTGCKELTLAIPVLAVLYDRTFLAGTWLGTLKRWRVHLALLVPPLVGIGYFFLRGVLGDDKGTVGFGVKLFTPWSYALTETEVLLYYLRLIAWPSPQCLDYIDWPARQSLLAVWPTALGLGVLLAITVYGMLRGTWWGFLAGWYFVILAPTSSIIPVQDAAFEHRLYLPLAGVLGIVVGLAVVGLNRLTATNPALGRLAAKLAVAAALGLMIAYGFLTVLRNEAYSSALVMWQDVVDSRPNNYRARGVLAGELLTVGRTDEAAEHFRIALEQLPGNPSNMRGLAFLYLEQGKTAAAANLFEQLAAATPDDPLIRQWFGVSLLLQRRTAEAVEQFRVGLKIQPRDKGMRTMYAAALLTAGKTAEADEHLAVVKAEVPRHAITLASNARQLVLDPTAKEGKVAYGYLLALAASRLEKDENPALLDTLATAEARLKNYKAAAAHAEQAAELARKAGDEYTADRIARRAKLYQANKPFTAEAAN